MKQMAFQWPQVDEWSPELISVWGNETGLCPVRHECLYQWVWSCKRGNKSAPTLQKILCQDFRHGNIRHKRGLRPYSLGIFTGRVSIEDRPAIVQFWKRVEDIEVDLIMGTNHLSQSICRTLNKATYPLHTLNFDKYKDLTENHAIGRLGP